MLLIMVLVVNLIRLFMTTLTVVTANYLNSNVSTTRHQQLVQSFYEPNRRPISVGESELGALTTTNPISAATTTSAQNLSAIRLANEHFLLIRTQYRCRNPRPKLIRVKDFYDVPSKHYMPRCTVLHQCDDESGCCDVGTERCAVQTSETVELYFYVIDANEKESTTGGNRGRAEVLTFVNHTRCHCQEINYMPRTKPMPHQWHSRPTHPHKTAFNFETTTQSIIPFRTESEPNKEFSLRCRCPHPFIARIRPSDERCICDCLERDMYCIQIKKGQDKLSHMEARCVRAGDCSEPLCDSDGTYSKHQARCVGHKHHNTLHSSKTHGRHHHQKSSHWLNERD